MRNEKKLLDSFMPLHEKEWESRVFIDEAIKSKSEYTLEAVARALSGLYNIELSYAEKDSPFKYTEHIESDSGQWLTKTKNYGIRAKMREYYFYGNIKIDIWLKVIDFWAGKVSIFPCGGASFPNEKFTCVHEDDKKSI